jgi:16S rRNA (guanine(966)-N(2))-methyltransferase RsmD
MSLKIETGKFKNQSIEVVNNSRTRYTPAKIRRALMSMFDVSNANILEFFAGSGIVSFEALSNGARKAVLIDISSKSVSSILKNAKKLSVLKNIKVINSDFRKSISKISQEKFDYIFADPPFNNNYVEEILKFISHNGDILEDNGFLIIEKHKNEQYGYSSKIMEEPEIRKYGDIEILIFRKK